MRSSSSPTFYDVVETSKAPVFASHSSARALAEHKRNMTDDMLRALAKNRGVIMINFNPPFLATEVAQASAAREEKLKPTVIRGELKRRGYSEGDIRKIMGENFIRVFAEVEKASRQMREKAE